MTEINIEKVIPLASLFLSLIAICVTLFIAWRQNKIALFDKRIDCYMKLQEYFESPIRWPGAIASKCYGTNNTSKNSYTRAKEADKLFLTAELLFPKKITKKLNQIHKNDREIAWRDYLIEKNLASIEHNEAVSKRILELFENDNLDFLTEAEHEELKELCKKYEFTHYEQVSLNKRDEYKCNMYEFSKVQEELSESNRQLEKEVMQEMKEEIQVGKLK